jgi:hypothetical protein
MPYPYQEHFMGTSPDLADLEPLGEQDRACLDELRAVLDRFGSLDRFGLSLLHDHFDVAPDERMMETCDPGHRTLTIRPEPTHDLEPGVRIVETSWRFGATGDVIAGLVCKVGCFVDLKDRHKRTHERVNG